MSNPIIDRVDLTIGNPLSINGIINKTLFLLAITAAVSFGILFMRGSGAISGGLLVPLAVVGMIGSFALGLMASFKPELAKTLAIPYACFEGLLVGGFSAIILSMYPSVPLTALCATFVTAGVMLGLFRSRLIVVTDKMRSIVMSAVIAIMLIYVVQWIFVAFGSTLPALFDGGVVAIGFSIFVIIIASFTLLINFDDIERAHAAGVDEKYEWVFCIGLLSTLVWMYVEFLRLLSFLED